MLLVFVNIYTIILVNVHQYMLHLTNFNNMEDMKYLFNISLAKFLLKILFWENIFFFLSIFSTYAISVELISIILNNI